MLHKIYMTDTTFTCSSFVDTHRMYGVYLVVVWLTEFSVTLHFLTNHIYKAAVLTGH